VHLANLVIDAGVKEDAFGRRRLAGIDVRHDAEVAITLDGCRTCHLTLPCRVSGPELHDLPGHALFEKSDSNAGLFFAVAEDGNHHL
jgi:hypothetical protein